MSTALTHDAVMGHNGGMQHCDFSYTEPVAISAMWLNGGLRAPSDPESTPAA